MKTEKDGWVESEVRQFTPLVFKIANSYADPSDPCYEDLVQCGLMALVVAAPLVPGDWPITGRYGYYQTCLRRRIKEEKEKYGGRIVPAADGQESLDEENIPGSGETPETASSRNSILEKGFSCLTDGKEEFVIRSIFGIGCTQLSLVEIARELGMSKQRVHSIKENALKKMKRHIEKEENE